ncbi:MAG: hypothetical protein AB7D38_12180 [Sulfurimonas sp.]|uniref:hypothetical protein n=1 Tax=Sulfurimonas sp. TaxID=2022749 RepID=UPI003D0B7720
MVIDANAAFKLGYALSGAPQRERQEDEEKRKLQRQVYEAEALSKGIMFNKEDGGVSVDPNSELGILRNQIKELREAQEAANRQQIGVQTFDLINDYLNNIANANDVNAFINSNKDLKGFWQNLGVDHVQDIDVNNKAHIDAIANAVGNTKFASYLDDNQISQDELRELRRNFLIVSDGKQLQLNSIENMLKITGATKYNFAQDRYNGILDNIKRSKSTFLNKYMDFQVEEQIAKTKYQREMTRTQEQITSGKALENDSRRIENATNMETLSMLQEARQQGLTYKDILAKSSKGGDGSTELMKNVEYISDNFGEAAADDYVETRIYGQKPAKVKTQEYENDVYTKLLEDNNLKNLTDVKYDKLNVSDKRIFDNIVRDEIKETKIDMKQISLFDTFARQAARINPDNLTKSTGPIDSFVENIKDIFGLTIDPDLVKSSSSYSAAVNTIMKANSGTAVSAAEMQRNVAQLGKLSRGDANVLVKVSGMVDDYLGSIDRYKSTSPAFYAKHLKQTAYNLKVLKKEIDKYVGLDKQTSGKSTIKPSKQKSIVVNNPDGSTTPIKLGGHYGNYQLIGINPDGSPIWKKVK